MFMHRTLDVTAKNMHVTFVCIKNITRKRVTWLYHGFVCGEPLECLRITPEMLHGETFPTTGGMQK